MKKDNSSKVLPTYNIESMDKLRAREQQQSARGSAQPPPPHPQGQQQRRVTRGDKTSEMNATPRRKTATQKRATAGTNENSLIRN